MQIYISKEEYWCYVLDVERSMHLKINIAWKKQILLDMEEGDSNGIIVKKKNINKYRLVMVKLIAILGKNLLKKKIQRWWQINLVVKFISWRNYLRGIKKKD